MLLDLFVNNEKTLLRIYEALFPHRAGNTGGSSLGAGGASIMQGNSNKEK
jgi:hypothetical protein